MSPAQINESIRAGAMMSEAGAGPSIILSPNHPRWLKPISGIRAHLSLLSPRLHLWPAVKSVSLPNLNAIPTAPAPNWGFSKSSPPYLWLNHAQIVSSINIVCAFFFFLNVFVCVHVCLALSELVNPCNNARLCQEEISFLQLWDHG